jgi:pimeloyl-ACP methyl ester carboxylesterase
MKEIYLISGLGADKRVFEFIDLSGFKLNHIDWIDPLDNEPIESYAKRLLRQITSNQPTLIGVSFGGMMAVEIGKIIDTGKIILVSSAKTRFDMPLYFRVIGQFRLHKLMSTRLLKSVNSLTHWFFGTKTKEEKDLLKSIITETNGIFLTWAVDKIVTWRNVTILKNTTHIHGTADRILPYKSADFKILDGGHLMIINKGEELSRLIRKVLS